MILQYNATKTPLKETLIFGTILPLELISKAELSNEIRINFQKNMLSVFVLEDENSINEYFSKFQENFKNDSETKFGLILGYSKNGRFDDKSMLNFISTLLIKENFIFIRSNDMSEYENSIHKQCYNLDKYIQVVNNNINKYAFIDRIPKPNK